MGVTIPDYHTRHQTGWYPKDTRYATELAHAYVDPTGWMHSVEVHPDHCGHGLGREVMALVVADADVRGLELSASCQPALVAWYEQFGFRATAQASRAGEAIIERPAGG